MSNLGDQQLNPDILNANSKILYIEFIMQNKID